MKCVVGIGCNVHLIIIKNLEFEFYCVENYCILACQRHFLIFWFLQDSGVLKICQNIKLAYTQTPIYRGFGGKEIIPVNLGFVLR